MGHRPVSPAISTIHDYIGEVVACGRGFLAFLLRPSLDDPGLRSRPVRGTVILFVVLCALMVPIGLLLLPLALAGNVAASGPLDAAMGGSLVQIWLSMVVLGPIVEELIFRSWLSRQMRQLAAGGAFVAVYLGGRAMLGADGSAPIFIEWLGVLAGALAIYLAMALGLRNTHVPRGYARAFPVVFWLNALGFGTLHLANYAGNIGPVLIAFTIPQIAAGAMFGYARVRIGLLSAIALHMAFNAIPVMAMSFARLL